MTSTQLSFGAFAAQTPDTVDFAVSDYPALRGCFLPSCPNPLPRFRVNAGFFTGSTLYIQHIKDGYPSSFDGFLDAPDYLPMGGHDSLNFSGAIDDWSYFEVVAFSFVSRV